MAESKHAEEKSGESGSPPSGEEQQAYVADFDDPAQLWRRLFAESLGTFMLTLVSAGAAVVSAVFGKPSEAAGAFSAGLVVMAVIYTIGTVSGAHINPAVTIAFWLRKDIPGRGALGYMGAQLVGATLAAGLLLAAFDTALSAGITMPGPGVSATGAAAAEVVLTALLVVIIIGTASSGRLVGPNSGIVVGGFVALASVVGGPVSGASMNPARSLGPALVAGTLGDTWIYLLGPFMGALLAVGIARVLHGPRSEEEVKAANKG